nr:sugar phosphate nucleotidyltransferase [Candidatus Krumholzibacteria bacterium]
MNDCGPDIQDIQGLILAAGYGTRLAPVTDHVPKPLLPVGGKTLLDHAVDNLTAAGVQHIAVNTHHLGAQVALHIEDRVDQERFTMFPEKEILGTGGALDNARIFLNRSPHFLIHNGDVLCDARLDSLIAEHLATGALATLLLVDWPAVNSVVVNTEGALVRIGGPHAPLETGQTALTYTGIGVFSRTLLADIGPGFSSLIDPLVRAKDRRPGSVRGFAPGGFHWSDLGTPARYLDALPTDHEASAEIEVHRITGHGSARRFWRIGLKACPLVAMVSPPDDEEFTRFVAIGRWLKERDLGAPELVAVNEAEHSVLMEDVGAERLFERATAAEADSAPDYDRVVDHLLRLQGATAQALQECPLAVDRVLDTAQLRWETDYFRTRFLVGHCGLTEAEVPDLDLEFASLAAAVARQPLVLTHRDFQSQNIHLQA